MPQPMAQLQQQEARSELGLPACLQEPAGSVCLKQTKTKAVQARAMLCLREIRPDSRGRD